MTSLGFPGLSSQPFRVFWRPENLETDGDDKTGRPRLVIPVRFGILLALFGQKTLKRTGVTSLGCHPSRFGFLRGPFPARKPKMDWDDKPGFPGLVIPIRFRFFWPIAARKPRNGLG